jgi:glutaminyl-tRNA synthetase
LHWVSADHAVEGEARLYDRLFTEALPDAQEGRDPLEFLNPHALQVVKGVQMEPALAEVAPGTRVQFERLGYFCADTVAPRVFHRTVGLRDEWAKIRKRSGS